MGPGYCEWLGVGPSAVLCQVQWKAAPGAGSGVVQIVQLGFDAWAAGLAWLLYSGLAALVAGSVGLHTVQLGPLRASLVAGSGWVHIVQLGLAA